MRSASIVGGTGIFLETSEHDQLGPTLNQTVKDALLGGLGKGGRSDGEPGDVVI